MKPFIVHKQEVCVCVCICTSPRFAWRYMTVIYTVLPYKIQPYFPCVYLFKMNVSEIFLLVFETPHRFYAVIFVCFEIVTSEVKGYLTRAPFPVISPT